MGTAIILQARMGSTRLPGKTLKTICDKSILEHVIERLKHSKTVDEIIVATTTSNSDDNIETVCIENGVKCFRGSENDVLSRYYHAAKENDVELVIRITADCPLIDPTIIDKLVNVYRKNGYDYISNVHPPTYPDGLDVEVFSFSALEEAFNEANLLSEREHVTPYIWKNKNKFKMKNIINDVDLSEYRWTVDREEDFLFIQKIYEHLYKKCNVFSTDDVLNLLNNHPKWLDINKNEVRNEGYLKSLKNDKCL